MIKPRHVMGPVNNTVIAIKNCVQNKSFNQEEIWGFLPEELLLKIIECFDFHHIKQVYKCCHVSKKWKVSIENKCDHIFKKAKDILQLKEEKGIPNKLVVFEGIQALRKKCVIGNQKLSELTHIFEKEGIFYDFKNELTSMKEARNGFNAHRLLTYVGQSTWNSVMQYLPVLAKGTDLKADDDSKTSYLESLCNALLQAMIHAVRHGFFDEAMSIYEKTKWGQKRNITTAAFLYFCYINQQFEQAEKFCTSCLQNANIAEHVPEICSVLLEQDNLEIVKQINTKVMPGLEKRALDQIKWRNREQGLEELFWIFLTYIKTRNFQHMNELLSEHPQLADKMMELYTNNAHRRNIVMVFLNEFLKGKLSERAKILDQTFHKMAQKLNKNTGLKRNYPFDNPFDDAVNDLKTAMEGLAAQLYLYRFGKNNWSNVQKYIPVLTKGTHARGFTKNKACLTILKETLTTALDHHFIEDALSIYRDTLWDDPHVYRTLILFYFFKRKEFEQAEQFIKVNELDDLDVVSCVLWMCGNLFEDDRRFEEAEQIVTKQLPLRAKSAKDILRTNQHAAKKLVFLPFNDEFKQMYKYFSNNLVSLGEDFAQLFCMLQAFTNKAGLDAQKKPQAGSI